MKLIGSMASPFVRKVRIVLADKKLDYDFVLENVWAPETTIQLFNPIGQVPCLMLDEAHALYDSSVIVDYLDTLTPVSKLIPSTGRERAVVKCWEALADGIADAAILIRQELTLRPKKQQSEEWIARQMSKVDVGLKRMAQDLGDNPYCVGAHYSLADVAVGCVLGWLIFRFPEINWRVDYPNLSIYFDRISERQSFKDTVPQ